MNYLLDTHTLIWFLNGDKDLSAKARKTIESSNALNFVSIASLWEIAIKVSLGRLDLKTSFEKIGEEIISNNFQILPITFQDTLILSSLPFHHRDPFDRLIIAQSINNKFTIISKDQYFHNYKVEVIW
ncbi:MAG: type II toxin-antitoxin system VapC family toxin [Ginsengibacter sp.]